MREEKEDRRRDSSQELWLSVQDCTGNSGTADVQQAAVVR